MTGCYLKQDRLRTLAGQLLQTIEKTITAESNIDLPPGKIQGLSPTENNR